MSLFDTLTGHDAQAENTRNWLYIAGGAIVLVGVLIAARIAAARGKQQIATHAAAPASAASASSAPTITTTPIDIPIPMPVIGPPITPPRGVNPPPPMILPPRGVNPPPPIITPPPVHITPPPTLTPPTFTPPPAAATPPPAQAPAPAPAPTRTYTVAPGDTLWAIAKRFYSGNGALYTKIVAANQATIQHWSGGNVNLIYPGETFVIPA